MFNLIRNLLAPTLETTTAAAIRSLRNNHGDVSRDLGITPTDPGSRGDQAILMGLLSELRRRDITRITILNQGAPWDQVPGLEGFPVESVAHFVSRRPEKLARRIQLGARHDALIVLGTDVMDGSYQGTGYLDLFKAARMFAQSGGKSLIAGISLSAKTAARVFDNFRALPRSVRVSARDPVSLARLTQAGVSQSFETADISFLLDPKLTQLESRSLVEWIRSEKGSGQLVIGLNINAYMPRYLKNVDEDAWIRIHLRSLEPIRESNPNLSLVLLPHDSRHDTDDFALAAKVAKELDSMGWPHECVHTSFGPEEIKAICASLDVVVTGRMHVALASISTGTPALSLGYHDKFEGLYQRLGMSEMHVSAADCLDMRVLSERIQALVDGRAQYQAAIARQLAALRMDAAKNVEAVLAQVW